MPSFLVQPFLVRPFIATDYPSALALWEATPGVGLSEADTPSAIAVYLDRNPGTSFVATDADVLVGTILCGHDGRRGLIHHLVTAATHRRRGIASLLLSAAMGALRERGIQKCHLLVFRTNGDGLGFWRSVDARERTDLTLFSLDTRDDPPMKAGQGG